jgi:hypothetical protein
MAVRKKKRISVFAILLLLVLILVALALAILRPKGDPARALQAALDAARPARDMTLTGIDAEIADAYDRCLRVEADGPFTQSFRTASGTVARTELDVARLTAGLSEELQTALAEKVAAAKRSSDLYTADGAVLPELYDELYNAAMRARLARAEDCCRSERLPVTLQYGKGGWKTDVSALMPQTVLPSRPGYTEAAAALTVIPVHYSLGPHDPSPLPNPACFGQSEDAQEVMQMLATPTAQRLINGQELDFDPNRDMLGRPIRWYLDETLLAVVWQQDEHGAIGTFAEVFIADESQLRRKLADDEFGSYQLYTASEMAAQTNAVVAGSGDYYNNGRGDVGLFVYDGQLMRCGLHSGQSCLFDGNGDMLFTYEDTFPDEESARRFIDENHVRFSLNWGPVLIDHGEDVTPYDYPFGEVRDTYARCAVGQLGTRHYLMMTINSESPDHNVYVTVRQAADSMIAHNCYNAYTLDGGQTASILIGGELINPVQFGEERPVSDIYYFATAVPN